MSKKEITTVISIFVIMAVMGLYGFYKFFIKYMSIPHSARMIAVEVEKCSNELRLLREEIARLRESEK